MILAIDCATLPASTSLECRAVSASGFLSDGEPEADFQAVIVGTASGQTALDILNKIRGSAALFNLPVFATHDTVASHPLCDGDTQGPVDDVIAAFGSRVKSMSINPTASFDNKVLSYLWGLPNRRLVPNADRTSPDFYNYQILNVLEPGRSGEWLADAQRRGLIAADQVVDRLRHCAGCNSPYLNYVDLCPHCQSIETEEAKALHCFTCGYVGDQEQYYRAQKLVCPKCQASLKHIGTDYDRPIETHQCHGCGQRFLEADIKCSCMACGRLNEQKDLRVRNVSTYKLTSMGEMYVRGGQLTETSPQVLGEPVGQGHFLWMLQWLHETAQSGANAPYLTLLTLRPAARGAASEPDLGENNAMDLLKVQLQSLLNPEDVFTALDAETQVILFPSDGKARHDAFVTDFEKLLDQTSNPVAELTAAGVALPNSDLVQDPMAWIKRQAR